MRKNGWLVALKSNQKTKNNKNKTSGQIGEFWHRVFLLRSSLVGTVHY